MFGRNYIGEGQRGGRGRGGLPRCSYPGWSGTTAPFGTGTRGPSAPTREEELDVLKRQAEATRQQLHDMETLIKELEQREEKSPDNKTSRR